jgi:hypothetical protein
VKEVKNSQGFIPTIENGFSGVLPNFLHRLIYLLMVSRKAFLVSFTDFHEMKCNDAMDVSNPLTKNLFFLIKGKTTCIISILNHEGSPSFPLRKCHIKNPSLSALHLHKCHLEANIKKIILRYGSIRMKLK